MTQKAALKQLEHANQRKSQCKVEDSDGAECFHWQQVIGINVTSNAGETILDLGNMNAVAAR